MVNIDNRPQQVAKVIAYRENALPLEAIIVGDLTGVNVEVELQNSSGMRIYSVETFSVFGNSVFIDFTKEEVAKMPAIAKCQVILNGVYTHGFEIKPERGFGVPSGTAATVQINLKGEKGDTGDITPEAAELAAQIVLDREAVADDKAQVSQDAEAVDLTATQIETKRQEVATNAEAVQEAKEEMLAMLPITVNSLDDLVLPRVKGFVLALLDTNFSNTPKKQLYYNDGAASVKGDLYTMPFDQLKNLL